MKFRIEIERVDDQPPPDRFGRLKWYVFRFFEDGERTHLFRRPASQDQLMTIIEILRERIAKGELWDPSIEIIRDIGKEEDGT